MLERAGGVEERLAQLDARTANPEVRYDERLVAVHTAFQTWMKRRNVLYPCCRKDASPARAYRKVTFVDIDPLQFDLIFH